MDRGPIKILYLVGQGVLGGVERHVQAIIRNLDRTRFDPELVVLMRGGPASDEIAALGVPVHVLGYGSGSDPRVLVGLSRLLARRKPKLVHAHELHAMSGLAFRLHPSVRWVQTEHCAFDHGPSPAKARFLWNAFGGGMDSILSVSNATGDALCRNTHVPRQRVRTVFNGVDLSLMPPKDRGLLRRELGLSENTVLVGAVGRMVRQKGWMDFLAAADEIARRMPEIHFVLVGDGPDAGEVRASLNGRAWADRGHWLGRRADAVALIGAMDLFLLTSLHEELPTTLLEAFSMGTPVAGYLPDGGVAEVMELAGEPPARLLKVRDATLLSEAVVGLLSNAWECERMTESARRVLPRFDMRTITRMLEAEYERVLGGGVQ